MRLSIGLMICAVLLVGVNRAQATCSAPASCVCETLPTQHVLRGRIASLEGSLASVDVHEVLVNNVAFAINPGATIVGRLDAVSACEMPEAAFAPGDEVLALWQGPVVDLLLTCDAFLSCSSLQCDSDNALVALGRDCQQSCFEASFDECPNALEQSRLVLIPWADTLDLGRGRQLTSDQAAVLGEQAECLRLFPAPPPEPCNDVILVPENGCGVAGSRAVSHADATWCGLLLLWAARRTSRRSRSRNSVPR